MKRGDLRHAIVVRTAKKLQRKDGSVVRFDDNACVLISKAGEPIGTRLNGEWSYPRWSMPLDSRQAGSIYCFEVERVKGVVLVLLEARANPLSPRYRWGGAEGQAVVEDSITCANASVEYYGRRSGSTNSIEKKTFHSGHKIKKLTIHQFPFYEAEQYYGVLNKALDVFQSSLHTDTNQLSIPLCPHSGRLTDHQCFFRSVPIR